MKKLTISHLGDNILFGKRFNGHDLGRYLRERGHSSFHLVWRKNLSDEYAFEIGKEIPLRAVYHLLCNELNQHFGTRALFYPFGFSLFQNEKFVECDILHLHLVHNNFFNLDQLPFISRNKPVVWTIHDLWASTGHCVYPMECNMLDNRCSICPDVDRPFSLDFDSARFNYEYKKNIYERSNFDVIVASEWMKTRVISSPLFLDKKIHVVPFGIDTQLFMPNTNHLYKTKLGFKQNDIVLAFRSDISPFKGLEHITDALNKLNNCSGIGLLTFGAKGLIPELCQKFKVIELGWIEDETELANAYNVADIFIMPSNAEAFGMMAIEAMACAKPVIVLEGTSLEEIVKSELTGCLVAKREGRGNLFNCLNELIKNKNKRMDIGARCRAVSVQCYNKDEYVNRIEKVYYEVSDKYIDNRMMLNSYYCNWIKTKKREKTRPAEDDENIIASMLYDLVNKATVRTIMLNVYVALKNLKNSIKAIKRYIKKSPFHLGGRGK